MLTHLLLLAVLSQSPHKPGELCAVVDKHQERQMIAANTNLETIVSILQGIEQGDLKPLMEAEEDGSIVRIPNATFIDGKAEMFSGKVLGIYQRKGEIPNIAKIQLNTESGRGKIVYLRDDYLMSPIELAIYVGELEKTKEIAAKLAKIEPAEITKAMKTARIAASRANLSVRKQALARERGRKIAELAAKHDVTVAQLDDFVKAKGLDK